MNKLLDNFWLIYLGVSIFWGTLYIFQGTRISLLAFIINIAFMIIAHLKDKTK